MPSSAQRQWLWDHGSSRGELGASLRGCPCTSPIWGVFAHHPLGCKEGTRSTCQPLSSAVPRALPHPIATTMFLRVSVQAHAQQPHRAWLPRAWHQQRTGGVFLPCCCPKVLRHTSTRHLHPQGFREVYRCACEKPPE